MKKKWKIFSFQFSTRTVDTVSASYSAITDVYNSILRSIYKFWVFEIRKKIQPQSHFCWFPFLILFEYIIRITDKQMPYAVILRNRINIHIRMQLTMNKKISLMIISVRTGHDRYVWSHSEFYYPIIRIPKSMRGWKLFNFVTMKIYYISFEWFRCVGCWHRLNQRKEWMTCRFEYLSAFVVTLRFCFLWNSFAVILWVSVIICSGISWDVSVILMKKPYTYWKGTYMCCCAHARDVSVISSCFIVK